MRLITTNISLSKKSSRIAISLGKKGKSSRKNYIKHVENEEKKKWRFYQIIFEKGSELKLFIWF